MAGLFCVQIEARLMSRKACGTENRVACKAVLDIVIFTGQGFVSNCSQGRDAKKPER